MGKYSQYKKHYNKEWENQPDFKGWLVGAGKDSAKCKLCNQELRPHKSDLLRHKFTAKHKEKEERLKGQTQLKCVPVNVSNPEKKFDIILAVYIATHSAIRSIDHLGEILNLYCNDQKNIRLHRTKCSSIILNVLEPAFREKLKSEIDGEPFSIILDESTDISQYKLMAYCVQYYNSHLKKIVVDFLGLQVVERATATVLSENFETFLADYELDSKNLIAIATDGANNMCGKNHSLFSILKGKYPKLQLLKCICHSLAICSQKACEELPSSLEFLLRESRNWFSHSPLRIQMYEEVFRKLNFGKKPPKLTQLSSTRWLAYNRAVVQNANQWNDLKIHFVAIAQDSNRSNNCYVARVLAQMYNDNTNFLYLLFLKSVLGDVDKLNLTFQSNKISIVDAYNDLRLLVMSLARRIFKPAFLKVKFKLNSNLIETNVSEIEAVKYAVSKADEIIGNSLLSDDCIDFGFEFSEYLLTTHNLSEQQVAEVQKRCRLFLVHLLKEMMLRLPESFAVVQKLMSFLPIRRLGSSQVNADMFPWDLLPDSVSKETILNQVSRLNNMKFEEIFLNDERDVKSIDIVEFWSGVSEVQNALGEKVYKDLAKFALQCLTLPISNAVVERVFSIMNSVKNKARNKMSIQMLNSILRTRLFLSVRNICCNEFIPTPEMYLLHNQSMYSRPAGNDPSMEIELITLYSADEIDEDEDELQY